MTNQSNTYQSHNPATLPEGFTPECEFHEGEARQVVAVRNPKDGTAVATSIASLPLPTGAATADNQTNGTQKAQISYSTTVAMVEARKQTPTGNALNVQIGAGDVISNIPVVMPFDHHQLHEGEMFRWSVMNTAGINAGVNKDIRIVVPSTVITSNAVTQMPHLRFEFVSDQFSTAFLYETPTFTGNGTQRTPIAMERNGTYTAGMQIWEDPTVSVVGTQLWQGLLTSSKQSAGAIQGSEAEFILKNNTSYLLRFTSGTNGTKYLIRLVWYEDLGV